MSNKNLMFFIILIEISLQFEYLYGLVDMLYRKIEYSYGNYCKGILYENNKEI